MAKLARISPIRRKRSTTRGNWKVQRMGPAEVSVPELKRKRS
jgi:hypothetical protein